MDSWRHHHHNGWWRTLDRSRKKISSIGHPYTRPTITSIRRSLVLILIYIRSRKMGQGGSRQYFPFGNWCSSPIKEKHIKPQQGKSKMNPPEESPGISNPREDPSWHQKKVIPRWQRENFVPTKLEIQIWVFNFGCGVEYSNIWRNVFPFARITFLLIRQSGKKADVGTILKILRPTPGSTHCFY